MTTPQFKRPADRQPQWKGHVLSWERKVRFGRELPCPHEVVFTCYADTAREAEVRLARLAARQGYALGGVLDVVQIKAGGV